MSVLAFLLSDKALAFDRLAALAAERGESGAESVVFAVQGIVLAALALVESGRGGEVSSGLRAGEAEGNIAEAGADWAGEASGTAVQAKQTRLSPLFCSARPPTTR